MQPQQQPQGQYQPPQGQQQAPAQAIINDPNQGKKTKFLNKTNPNSTQNILKISEIRDGLVIMNDGSYRAVIFAKSINFDLMSEQEREAVELGYQGFLNNLYFPVQIFIRSSKIDISQYLNKLGERKNTQENLLLALMMDDYINFISEITAAANIMAKKFYVVIPFHPNIDLKDAKQKSKGVFSAFGELFGRGVSGAKITITEADLEAAKIELKNRSQAILGGLANVGVQSVVLNTQELIELYYDAYNPDTATYQTLSENAAINTPIITQGSGQPPYGLERGL